MKEKALRGYFTEGQIHEELKFYQVLSKISDKLTKDSLEANFDYLMAYKDRVENLIKREPWNKRPIGDDFYNDLFDGLSTDKLIFYYNDVVRYNIYFGYRRIKTLIEKATDIQKYAENNPGVYNFGDDYLADFLGERFETEVDGSLTRAHFIEQEKIIDMYYKHFEATLSGNDIMFRIGANFHYTFQLFYETTRNLLTNADADIQA